MEKNGYVYLIRNKDNNLLKIGCTNNIERRLRDIQKSFQFVGQNPKLEIEYLFEHSNYKALELFLHKEFEKYNIQNEWYDIQDINLIIEKAYIFPLTKEDKQSPKEDKQFPTVVNINKSKIRKIICLETKQIFNTFEEAARLYGGGGIRNCCKGITKTACGFHWQFLDDYRREQRLKSDIRNSRQSA